MTAYPSTLPQPLLEGFSSQVNMGVIRADMPTHEAQRRVFTTMPHVFTMTFLMQFAGWADWYQWVKANGYSWFTMNIPTLYAGRTGDRVSAVLIRFTSDIDARNVSDDFVQVTMAAEMAPSMHATFLANT